MRIFIVDGTADKVHEDDFDTQFFDELRKRKFSQKEILMVMDVIMSYRFNPEYPGGVRNPVFEVNGDFWSIWGYTDDRGHWYGICFSLTDDMEAKKLAKKMLKDLNVLT